MGNLIVVWRLHNDFLLTETAWVLSRQRTIPAPVQQIVNGVINQFLVPTLLRTTVQDPAR